MLTFVAASKPSKTYRLVYFPHDWRKYQYAETILTQPHFKGFHRRVVRTCTCQLKTFNPQPKARLSHSECRSHWLYEFNLHCLAFGVYSHWLYEFNLHCLLHHGTRCATRPKEAILNCNSKRLRQSVGLPDSLAVQHHQDSKY